MYSRHERKADMSAIASITFFDICMALVIIGLAERVLLAYSPASMVGRTGWLLRGDIED